MSHGNIYRYFSDKEAIIDTIARRWLAKITGPLQEIVAGRAAAASQANGTYGARQKRPKPFSTPPLFFITPRSFRVPIRNQPRLARETL
jgi:AcrR family transcriptional regulator